MPQIEKQFQNKAEKDNTKIELEELSAKVMLGLQKAIRKLVEESAAKNRSLVVKINGEIKKVPAKDLLHTLPS
jgi:hypothetical protein